MKKPIAKALWLSLLILTGFFSIASADEVKTYRIGVLAFRGEEHAILRWAPTAQYLNEQLENYNFELVPIDLDTISNNAETHGLDFVLTNAAQSHYLADNFGASRLASLCVNFVSTTTCRFGSVIFTRSDNPEITSLSDLKGKKFVGVHAKAFGGFLMAKNELLNQGIDADSDFSELLFSGFPHDRVVYAIRDGIADAGTIRTGILESLASEGKIRLEDYRILASKNAPENGTFPLRISTQTYPEWSFTSMKHVAHEDAKNVAQALYAIQPDHLVAKLGRYSSWTVPMDDSQIKTFLHNISNAQLAYLPQRGDASSVPIILLALLLSLFGIFEVFRFNKSRENQRISDKTIADLEVEVMRRKVAESKSSRFARIIEGSQNDIFILNADNLKIQHINKSAASHLHFERDEMIGECYNKYIYGLSEEALRKTIAPLILNPEKSASAEVQMVPKSGATYHGECFIQYLMEDDEPILVFTVYDLTERKKVERVMKQNERSLQNAQRIANLGHWDWNILDGELHWSDQIYRIFGLTPREFEATYDAFLERVHPDDRDAVTGAVNAALELNGPDYNMRHRVIQPSGNIRHVEEQGEITRDENGAPIWMTGIVVDITEKLIAEKRLKELGGSQ